MLLPFRTATAAIVFAMAMVSALAAAKPKFITAEELDQLPVGIKVVHKPKVALATLTGESERRAKYTWHYATTVTAIDADLTIEQFGALVWWDGKWVNGGSFTGKPYAAKELEEWYKCPRAVLRKGKSYTDPTNWSSDAELRAGKARWYFVGVNANGQRVKGEALITLKAEIDPKKPRDPE